MVMVPKTTPPGLSSGSTQLMTRRSIGTSYRRGSMSTIAQLVTGVDFVVLPTHDVEKAAEFYGETLGLRRSVYMPERHFAEFENGKLTLSVINAEGMGLEHHVQHHEVALHVEDVQAARSLLEERGVRFRGETLDT